VAKRRELQRKRKERRRKMNLLLIIKELMHNTGNPSEKKYLKSLWFLRGYIKIFLISSILL